MTDNIAKPTNAWHAMASAWQLPEALMGGTRAMRDAGLLYLPREGVSSNGHWKGESIDAYNRRLHRTTLFNAFRRAVHGLRGKVFAKPIILDEDAPQRFTAWADDIDLQGRDLTAFAFDLFETGLVYGQVHVLVDYPRVPEGATAADERRLNARPYLVPVSPVNLIGWQIDYESGQRRLLQIRIRETVEVADGEYGVAEVNRIRVIYPDRWEIWTDSDGEYMLSEQYANPLGVIPLATLYTGRTADMIAEPPLEDLAWKNLEHWQSSSDQRHILHVARVPLLFGAGLEPEEGEPLEIGPNQLISARSENAKLQFVEHSGQAVQAGADDLARIEDQMRLLSLEPMLPKTGDPTATARALDQAEANSALQAWALNLQDTLEQALYLMDLWQGRTDGAGVDVNTRYGLTLDKDTDLQALGNLRTAGDLSRETLWGEYQRRGTLNEDFDAEEEADRIEAEGPPGMTTDTEDPMDTEPRRYARRIADLNSPFVDTAEE